MQSSLSNAHSGPVTRKEILLSTLASVGVTALAYLYTLPGPEWVVVGVVALNAGLVFMPAKAFERLFVLRRGLVAIVLIITLFLLVVNTLPVLEAWPLVVYGVLLGRLQGLTGWHPGSPDGRLRRPRA